MTAINTNLDKICAQYGMELLSLPERLYDEVNRLIEEICENSKNKEDIYKNKKEIEEKINNRSDWTDSMKEFVVFQLAYILNNKKNRIIKSDKDFEKLKQDIKKEKLSFSPETFETEITKAISILVEDGPFAYIIWLKSQDKEPHRTMLIQTARLLNHLHLVGINTNDDLKAKTEEEFLNIAEDITKTLFIKTVIERMLIYARYKAKAMQHK